jgi:hypothetical protein
VRTRQALLQWIADVEQALAAMPGTAEAPEEVDRVTGAVVFMSG